MAVIGRDRDPAPLLRASFDREVLEDVAVAIGTQARDNDPDLIVPGVVDIARTARINPDDDALQIRCVSLPPALDRL